MQAHAFFNELSLGRPDSAMRDHTSAGADYVRKIGLSVAGCSSGLRYHAMYATPEIAFLEQILREPGQQASRTSCSRSVLNGFRLDGFRVQFQ